MRASGWGLVALGVAVWAVVILSCMAAYPLIEGLWKQ